MQKPSAEKLETARIRAAQTKARYDAVLARERTKDKKKEARRQFVLGRSLILAAESDAGMRRCLQTLVDCVSSERDQKLFAELFAAKPGLAVRVTEAPLPVHPDAMPSTTRRSGFSDVTSTVLGSVLRAGFEFGFRLQRKISPHP